MNGTDTTGLVIHVGLGLLAVGFALIGVLQRRRQRALRATWQRVEGRVTGTYSEGEDSDGVDVLRPVVEYRTLKGETIEARPVRGTRTAGFLGERRVQIWYHPEIPEICEAQISFLDRRGTAALIGAGVLAVLFLLVSLAR